MSNYDSSSHLMTDILSSIVLELVDKMNSLMGVEVTPHESNIITQGLRLVRTITPNNYNSATRDLGVANEVESGYNYLIYKLNDKYRAELTSYNKNYHKVINDLVRLGKAPNQTALIAMSMSSPSTNPKYDTLDDWYRVVTDYENLIEFFRSEMYTLKSKMRTIDAIRANTL